MYIYSSNPWESNHRALQNIKSISMTVLWYPKHSVIKADFIMAETQQPIAVIISIVYLLKDPLQL